MIYVYLIVAVAVVLAGIIFFVRKRKKTKKKIFYLICCISALYISSCTPIYEAVNKGFSPGICKPVSDSTLAYNYISASFSRTVSTFTYNTFREDYSYFGNLYGIRSVTKPNYNVTYGLATFGGIYNVADVQKYRGDRSYYGGEALGEISLRYKEDSQTDCFVGIRSNLIYENGKYFDFRQKAAKDTSILNFSPVNMSGALGIFVEASKPISDQVRIGTTTYWGSFFSFKSRDFMFSSLSLTLFASYKRFNPYFQYNFVSGSFSVYAFGVNYRI